MGYIYYILKISQIKCLLYDNMDYNNVVKKLKLELKRKEIEVQKLRSLVLKDELTGVYNRRGFIEELKRIFGSIVFSHNHSNGRRFCINSLSLLFFDIDNFKQINDTYGHKTGDRILQYVTGMILKKVRSIDIVGRLGGEEIAAALVGSDEHNAYLKAEEIRKAIEKRIKTASRKRPLQVTVSIGIAQLEKGMNLDGLIKAADTAMYRAKKSGKNKTIKYSEIKKLQTRN